MEIVKGCRRLTEGIYLLSMKSVGVRSQNDCQKQGGTMSEQVSERKSPPNRQYVIDLTKKMGVVGKSMVMRGSSDKGRKGMAFTQGPRGGPARWNYQQSEGRAP